MEGLWKKGRKVILFMSATNKHFIKTFWVYAFLSVFAFVLTHVYAIFGHGVRSSWMDFMFLYPLIGGVLHYTLIAKFLPYIKDSSLYRLAYNIHGAALATLMVSSFLIGVMGIAGTSSIYNTFMLILGIILVISALGIHIYICLSSRKVK